MFFLQRNGNQQTIFSSGKNHNYKSLYLLIHFKIIPLLFHIIINDFFYTYINIFDIIFVGWKDKNKLQKRNKYRYYHYKKVSHNSYHWKETFNAKNTSKAKEFNPNIIWVK